jgi:hypothetical protein
MMRGNIGVVDDDVVVVRTSDSRFRTCDPKALSDVTLAGQHLDPDHFVTCTASRNCRPNATASS